MTDDLVTRLRGGFPTSHGVIGVYPDVTKAVAMMQEAAARIEQDAATIARLEGELQEQHRVRKAWAARAETAEAKVAQLENERIVSNAAYDGVSSLLLSVQQDCITAEKKVAALVEALEQLVIEYDEVDLAIAEPKSLTDAVSAARAAIAAAKGGA